MLKIIYAGTPEFAVPALEALLGSEHEVVAVYTQPDRPAGRGRKLQQSPVKDCAIAHDIAVVQPKSLKNNVDIQRLIDFRADLMVVAAYGLLLPQAVLDAPRLGCINIHASLLPRWRGAAPIQRAILAGDADTGITIMQMALGLDTGDMLAKQAVKIHPDWNAGDLHDAIKTLGAELLVPTIEKLSKGDIEAEVQDESKACYATKLTKQEAEIDWAKSALDIQREIRAFAPWPVSFTHLDDKILRIWRADALDRQSHEPSGTVMEHNKEGVFISCGEGILQVGEMQFAGKNRCSAAQALNGRNLTGLVFNV
jgi:methionyl-tRNA formyltransferase